MPEETLGSAIEDAVKNTPAPAPAEEISAPAEEKAPEAKEPEPDTSLGLSEVEQVQAKQLFAALKDPGQAPAILKYLAEQAGYIRDNKAAAVVKDDIMSVLEENLGPEFEIISKRLGPALDKIISKKVAESQADIRSTIKESEEAKLAADAGTVMSSLAKRYFDADAIPDKVQSAMQKQMEKMNPTEGMSVEDYITDVFSVVAFKEGITPKTIDKSARIERNRTDAPSRLASARAAAPKEGDVVQNEKMSLRDSIEKAVEALGKTN
jgi:hypothetical protein